MKLPAAADDQTEITKSNINITEAKNNSKRRL